MKRIQRKRTKGWRMPEGAVYVGRPTRWGNDITPDMPHINSDAPLGIAKAVELNRLCVLRFADDADPADVEAWLAPLRDATALACWCPLSQPCHADVLIALLEDTA